MKRSPSKALLVAGAALLALAIPAVGQETPESLLPPGFTPPPPPPPPAGPAQPAPGTATPAPPPSAPAPSANPAPRPSPSVSRPPPPSRSIEALLTSSDEDLEALAEQLLPDPIEIPEASRRSVDGVGPLGAEGWGMGRDAFGAANGRFLSTLMRRTEAPLPSRWASILLRRALLSPSATPSYVHPVDWIAERAWLLLRMGEADGARMLVQAVDVDRFTPKMFTVAVQSALANADPAGLCPLIEPGRETSDEPVWAFGDAMCAALEGEPARASALIDQARRRSRAPAIDITLAEKIIGAGANTRRAVTVQWDDVGEVNSWRFGLASAAGVLVPERLMDDAGAHVRAWQARAPMIPLEDRVAAAEAAATLGVFSSASLVEMYSLLADAVEPSELGGTIGGQLREAHVAPTLERRLTALRGLWNVEGDDPVISHARHILTATAARRIPPSEAAARDAGDLIAAMFAAGYDQEAARWAETVEAGDAAQLDRAWSMLAVGAPEATVDVSAGRVRDFVGRDDSEDGYKGRLLAAALAGLGRLEPDEIQEFGVQPGARNAWSEALMRAARERQPGTVALLAAAGMQTGGWAGVPPEHLYHIVAALREVGLEYYARMIAAEAMARS